MEEAAESRGRVASGSRGGPRTSVNTGLQPYNCKDLDSANNRDEQGNRFCPEVSRKDPQRSLRNTLPQFLQYG